MPVVYKQYAVVLGHPELRLERITKESQITANNARTVDMIYSLTDDEMERALSKMNRNIKRSG